MLKIHPEGGRQAELGPPLALTISRRVTFSAAHVLRRADWDERRNREVFGSCANDHGHNYVLEVSVSGAVDPDTGMVLNLKDLDRAIRDGLVQHLDHRHLNRDVPFLEGVMPTAENLALAFWEQLERELRERAPGCRLRRLRVAESENNAAEVTR